MNANILRGALLAVWLSIGLPWAGAQPLTVDLEEFRRLAGEVADLRDASVAQQRRITQLQKEVEALRSSLRDANERATTRMGEMVTREDLKKAFDRIQEVDQKREADRRLILDEFEKLGKTLATPADRPDRRRRDREKEPEPDVPAAPIEGTFYPHKVAKGESLGEIISKYNAHLAEKGLPKITLSQVRAANPKVNIDRIYVGQEILLPVPEKK